MTNPCKRDCPDRCPTCHTNCERYKGYEAKKTEARKARMKESQAIGATCDGARRRTNYKPMI